MRYLAKYLVVLGIIVVALIGVTIWANLTQSVVATTSRAVVPAVAVDALEVSAALPVLTSHPRPAIQPRLVVIPVRTHLVILPRNPDGSIKAAPPNHDSPCPGTEPCDDPPGTWSH